MSMLCFWLAKSSFPVESFLGVFMSGPPGKVFTITKE